MADIPAVVDVIADPEKENSLSFVSASKSTLSKLPPTLSLMCDDEEQFGIELNLDEVPYVLSSTRSANMMNEPHTFDFTSSKGLVEEPVQAEKTAPGGKPTSENEENHQDQNLISLPTTNNNEDPLLVDHEPELVEQTQPQDDSPSSLGKTEDSVNVDESKLVEQTQPQDDSPSSPEKIEDSVNVDESRFVEQTQPQDDSPSSLEKVEDSVNVDESKLVEQTQPQDEQLSSSLEKVEEPVIADEIKLVELSLPQEKASTTLGKKEEIVMTNETNPAELFRPQNDGQNFFPVAVEETKLSELSQPTDGGKNMSSLSVAEQVMNPAAETHSLTKSEDQSISLSSTIVMVEGGAVDEETKISERKMVDYDKNPSALYKAMQLKDWKLVMDRVDQNPDEVFTWIIRKDKDGMTRWCLLPIHAALIFKAPVHVVVKLISIYPESGLCKDDQGMVPLHLAFRHGASDAVLYEILCSCPDAIDVKDDKGRTPLALHSTYVARANAQETPTNGADNTQKMRPSAFERYVTIAAERARKSTKSKLEAHYVAKLKTLHDEHTEQLENLRKLASEEFSASREKIKELEKKKRILEANLNEKKKEAEDLSTQNQANKVAISNMESLLEDVTKAKNEEKVVYVQKITKLEADIIEINKKHEQDVRALDERAKASERNVSELISKYTAAEVEISDLKKTNAELGAKGDELKSVVEERLAENEELSKKYEDMCESENSLRAMLSEHEQSLEVTSKALRDSEALLSQMNSTILDLRSDIATKTTNILTLKEDKEKLIIQNNELKEKADIVEQKNRELSNSNEVLKMKCHIQSCENQSLTEQVSELSSDIAQNTEKLKQSEETCKELKLSLESIELQLKMKIEEEEAIKSLLVEKEFEYDQYKSSAEDEIHRLSQDLGSQVIRTSECELQFNDLEQTFSKLQRKFEAKCNEAAALDAELEETRAQSLEELETKEKELNRMMASLSDYNIKFQEIAKSSEVLVVEFKAKCEEEAELRFQLEQVQSEFEEMVALKDNEFCNLNEKYDVLGSEALELRGVVQRLEEEQAASKSLIAELSQNLFISQDEISKLEQKLRDCDESMKISATISQANEQKLEVKISELELEGFRSLERSKELEKYIEELEGKVKELKEEGEAKDYELKQKIVEAEMNLKDITNKLEEVTASSANQVEELKLKIAEKTKENLRHHEKNHLLEEVTSQLRKRAMELEEEKNRSESQLKEKLMSLEEEHKWLQHRMMELDALKEQEMEETNRKAAEKQAKLDRELKHLQSVNEKKTEMNTTLQRQLREMSSHMQQLTDNLLRLSAKHEKFVETAASHGVSFDGLRF